MIKIFKKWLKLKKIFLLSFQFEIVHVLLDIAPMKKASARQIQSTTYPYYGTSGM
jgi:hypothetical protein